MNLISYFQPWSLSHIKKIGFEDMKTACDDKTQYIIINTMSYDEQNCLIKNTINIHNEEKMINEIIDNYEIKKKKIIIYGKNCQDNSVENKSKQLYNLGFSQIYIYNGGLFEWLLLQDIYGCDEFKTTTTVIDLLKYKPCKIL
jgi:hypothetical protein